MLSRRSGFKPRNGIFLLIEALADVVEAEIVGERSGECDFHLSATVAFLAMLVFLASTYIESVEMKH